MLTPILIVLPLIAPATVPAVDDDIFPERTFHAHGVIVQRGDFNGDGHQDLVVSELYGVVHSLLGDGHGDFALGDEIDVGSEIREFVVGDYDRDGAEDVAAATGSGDVVILLGDGAGGFSVHATLRLAADPRAMAGGDFDGDGILDLATVNGYSSGIVTVLLGSGTGDFTQHADLTFPNTFSDIAVADFDLDGQLDLAITVWDPGSLIVLRGLGGGDFEEAWSPPAWGGLSQVAVLDANGDAFPDLVVDNSGSVATYLGQGDCSFAYVTGLIGSSWTDRMVVDDFDADGISDVAMAYTTSQLTQADVWLGKGNGTYYAPPKYYCLADKPGSIVTGDFDEDGHLDLATSTVTILRGIGDGTFESNPEVRFQSNAEGLVVADFDKDGLQDFACASHDGFVGSWISDGQGGVQLMSTQGGPGFHLGIAGADFNGDGDIDLAVPSYSLSFNRVDILLGQGNGSFTNFGSQPVGVQPSAIVASDFDEDGKQDLALTTMEDNKVGLLLGRGNGLFKVGAKMSVGVDPRAMAVADLDVDGHLDLVTTNYDSLDVTVLLGHGDGTFTLIQGPTVTYHPLSVTMGDFNRDGLPDLAVAIQDHPWVAILLGVGGGQFSVGSTPANDRPYAVAVSDIDGDGDQDLVTANWNCTASVLLGQGDGSFAWQGDYAIGSRATGVAIIDLVADGMPDAITLHPNANCRLLVNRRTTWEDLGCSLAGTLGDPHLSGSGTLQTGSPGALVLGGAAPSAPALLFVALGGSPTPFKGGLLVPVPPLVVLALQTSAAGSSTLAWAHWPAGVSGLSVSFQWAIKDVGAPAGVALSNALLGHVP